MSEDKYIQSLIAHYLKDKCLTNTLHSLELELNTKFNSTPIDHDESLESIIKDRINFKLLGINSANSIDDRDINTIDTFTQSDIIKSKNITLPNWSIKYPSNCEVINLGSLNSLIINSTFFKAFVNDQYYNLALFVTNTKYLFIYDIDSNQIILSSFDPLNGQPIKIICGIDDTDNLILCDMNGSISSMKLTLSCSFNDDPTWKLINQSKNVDNIKLHRRLITDFKYLKFYDSNDPSLLGYFASIGWDSRVTFGRVSIDKDNNNTIKFSLIGEYKLFTNPTSLLLIIDKKSNLPVILVGRLESSLITLFTISSNDYSNCKLLEIAKLSLNDSEFSSHSFQPMTIAQISSFQNDTIITIGTDHIPYMRLITVLVPSIEEIFDDKNTYYSEFSDCSSLQSKLDRISSFETTNNESFHSKAPILRSYIISNFNSLSPQDKYSNAIILSRPQCSALWIPGDDGKLRGFDLRTGSVIETLDSNDGRAKSAFIGNCGLQSEEVVVVCGAVDKKIVIWRCSD